MSKALKILTGLLVLLVILVGTVFFLASRYLNEERIKAFLIPPLEEASGLKVHLGTIKRQGFAGVVVRKVAFLDPATREKVLSTDEIRLALDLWPLLHGKLVVTKLVFVHPDILLVREKDGTLNLARYFGGQAEKPPVKKGARQEKVSSERGEAPKWALVFQHLAVEGAHVAFRDLRKELPPVDLRFSLASSLHLRGGQLSLEGDQEISSLKVADYPVLQGVKSRLALDPKGLSLVLKQGEVLGGSVSGEVKSNFEDISGQILLQKASFKAADQLLAVLRPYFFPQASLPKLAGNFALKADFKGPLAKPDYALSVQLAPLSVTEPPYQVSLSGAVSLDPKVLRPALRITVNGQTVALSGKVWDWQTKLPSVDVALKADHLDLKALVPASEKTSSPKAKTGRSSSSKTTQAPLLLPVKGKLRVQAQSICYDVCVKDLKAQAQLAPQKADILAQFVLAKGQVKTAIQVKDLAKVPRTAFTFKVDHLLLPQLLQAVSPKSAYVTSGVVWAQGAFRTKALTAEVVQKNLKGKGEARFAQLGLKEIPAAVIAADLLGVPDLARLSFDKGRFLFSVARETVNLDGVFSRPGLALTLRGDVALKGYLDLKPVLVFDEPYASKLRKRLPGSSFLEDQGKLEVPLEVKGPFAKPKVRLRLTKKIKKKLEEKVKEKLFEFLR